MQWMYLGEAVRTMPSAEYDRSSFSPNDHEPIAFKIRILARSDLI